MLYVILNNIRVFTLTTPQIASDDQIGYSTSMFNKLPQLPPWLWFMLLLVIFELIADIFAKQFGITGKIIFGVLAILGFILANLAWLFSLRNGAELSKGSILFSALSALGAVLLGIFVYHE